MNYKLRKLAIALKDLGHEEEAEETEELFKTLNDKAEIEDAFLKLIDRPSESNQIKMIGIEWGFVFLAAKALALWFGKELMDTFIDYIKKRGINYAMKWLASNIFMKYVEDPDKELWGENIRLLEKMQNLKPNKDNLNKLSDEQRKAYISEVIKIIESDSTKPFDVNANDIMETMFSEIFAKEE